MSTIKDSITAEGNHNSVIHSSYPQIPSSKLYGSLKPDTIIVTSNQRLSRFRLQQYEQTQIKQGNLAWNTPNILPWSSWIQQQWQNHGQGITLNHQQESLLWRNCIVEDKFTQVLNPKALSKQAMDAWNILADYQIDPSCLQYAGEEHAALWRWGKSINTQTTHTLRHQILNLLLAQTLSPVDPTTIILDGFDTFTPAQRSYFDHLQTLGCQVFEVTNNFPKAEATVHVYQDAETELRQICQRIRSCLDKNPEYHIGVFIPDLEQRSTEVARIFTEELVPELSLALNPDLQGEYFNISLGSSVLAKQPMIQSAFSILSLSIKSTVKHHEFTTLLLNPYVIGHAAEKPQRASLDAELRKYNQHTLSLEQYIKLCKNSNFSIPVFQQFIESIAAYINQKAFTGKHFISHWLILTENLLTQFEWHEQASNPHESTQVQNFRDLMAQLTGLDDFCGSISWSEALSRLQEHAHEQLFRPAPGLANIQIMGLLEAANLRFDHAFVLGMDDATWPPTAKPHPLIPFDVQALHQTPHANSEREWLYAQTVWENIQHASPALDISYATSKGSQEVQASPLLQGIDAPETELHPSLRYTLLLQQHSSTLNKIALDQLAVAANEDIRGGTGLLKSQAACYFQAFVRYRLHLEALKTPTLGLNAAEQGTLLHTTLEEFWKKVKSHKALLALIESDQLKSEIKISIHNAWSSLNRLVAVEIKTLEEQRLQQLIHLWLNFESSRKPFEAKEFEVWRNIKLGDKYSLTLHTKLDRIDNDAEGNHIIIDYKTGLSSASKALGERPEEPQLPAYFLAEHALNIDTNALAFAQVRSGDIAFKGFAQQDHILPHIRAYKGKNGQAENWEELTAQWQEVLNDLADEFMHGESSVTPKNPQSCNYCDFEGICQINR